MILTFPYYDPQGVYNAVFRRQLDTLHSTFDAIYISAIPPTSRDNAAFVRYLENQGCAVYHNPPGTSFGAPSREALRFILEGHPAPPSIFFGFLDRMLFALETQWRRPFLQDLQAHAAARFLVFERSPAAWETHPANYRELEHMVSRALELLSGRFIELAPGGFILSPAVARLLLQQSTSESVTIWGEWVLLAIKNDVPVTTLQVDWLAWEDPFWEGVPPATLKRSRETSPGETLKRIRWNAPLMLMLAEQRFAETWTRDHARTSS